MLFGEGFAGRGIFHVCDQLEEWPNGGAMCAETGAVVDLEDELSLQGQKATCGYRMPGFERRIGDFLSQVFLGFSFEEWTTLEIYL